MKKIIYIAAVAAAMLTSCKGSLDPMPNGHYTDENLDKFPSLLKGFVDKAYSIANYSHYLTNQGAYLDCATDNGVLTGVSSALRLMANGALSPTNDPFETYWSNDYQGIYYVNRFLKDNKGINTQYLLDQQNDRDLRRDYQGDAYALRAWFAYDLLSKFAGKDDAGNALGVVLIKGWFDQSTAEAASFKRATFAECAQQIIDDCDSALVYLPLANRNWIEGTNPNIEGSQRWGRFDQMSVVAIKALTYLLWASDAFNVEKDNTLWEKAAECAAQAMQYKLDYDFVRAGKTPQDSFSWFDPNSYECYLAWKNDSKTTTYESNLYPVGFRGSATLAPSQELVDAFPMANGYPITDNRSGYDKTNPYAGRDPRFYSTIYYNGSEVVRSGKTEVMYTFDMKDGGADASGQVKTGLTNYYLKKFVYTGWNANDQNVESLPRTVFALTWRDMCLTFAEAANRAYGPTTQKFGFTAKQALAYIRNRTTTDGVAGLGVAGDPYLDECAGSKSKFEELVRNERRIEFCFEGKRFGDLVRWDVSLEERNKPVHGVKISASGAYDFTMKADNRALTSKYLPIPYADIQRAHGLVQNAGWTSWTTQK